MRAFENDKLEIAITVAPRGGIKARCSNCRQPSTGYDHLPERRWEFMPLWGIPTHCIYARGVQCGKHGVVVEHNPWSGGKRSVNDCHDGVSCPLGAVSRLARDGHGVRESV